MSYNVTKDDAYHKRMALTFGSIVSKVEERAKEQGFVNKSGGVALSRLARESGISTATLHFLFNRPETFRQLNLITLAKLCRTLRCQPGDLFQYVPGLSSAALGIDTSFFSNLQGTR